MRSRLRKYGVRRAEKFYAALVTARSVVYLNRRSPVSLEILRREKEGVVILDLKGAITMGNEDIQFRQYIQSLPADARVILNLKDIRAIDTAGMGTLTLCALNLRKTGGRLALFNLSQSHIELVVLLKLDSMFEIFGDEQSAVDSFFPDRKVNRYDILAFAKRQNEGSGDTK
jgi:anti-sigma B factor antagonist